jgi:hypothetical protein
LSLRTIGILGLMVLGLGIYIYFGIQKPAEENSTAGDPLVSVDLSRLQSVQLLSGETKVVLEKEDQGWRMLQPVNDIVSLTKIDQLTTALKQTRLTREIWSKARVAEKPDGLKAFGLAPARAKVMYKTDEMKEPSEFLMGGKNPSFSGIYFQNSAGEPVSLGSLELDYLAGQRAEDWREMRLITVESEHFERISLRRKNQSIQLERVNNQWVMSSPFDGLPLDQDFTRSQIEKMGLIRANIWHQEEPKAARSPQAAKINLTITFAEGQSDRRTTRNDPRPLGTEIQLFRLAPSKPTSGVEADPLVYAYSDKASWATVSAFHFEQIDKPAEDYIKKTFDDFLVTDVTDIAITMPGQSAVDLKRGEDSFLTADGTNVEISSVENLLRQLRSIRAMRFLEVQNKIPSKIPASLKVELKLTNGEQRSFTFFLKKDASELVVPFKDKFLSYLTAASPIKIEDFTWENLTKPSSAEDSKKEEAADSKME